MSGGTLCSSDVVDGFGWPHIIKKRDFRGDGKGNRRSGRRGDGRQGRGGGPKEQAPAQLESRLFDLISNPQKLTKKQEAVLQVRAGVKTIHRLGRDTHAVCCCCRRLDPPLLIHQDCLS